jgi:hypothetical protein
MKKLFIIVLIGIGIYQWFDASTLQNSPASHQLSPYSDNAASAKAAAIQHAFNNQQSQVQVTGTGQVIKILADDNQGSRHQRFILSLSNGQTILIAHNIDLAPRINTLSKGDNVEFYGQYEWNNKGGVVHWTHHDPKGRHVGGWLKHKGKVYQ